jgi:hypothetical protein
MSADHCYFWGAYHTKQLKSLYSSIGRTGSIIAHTGRAAAAAKVEKAERD